MIKKCLNCKNTFKTNIGRKNIFCSKDCRSSYRREYNNSRRLKDYYEKKLEGIKSGKGK